MYRDNLTAAYARIQTLEKELEKRSLQKKGRKMPKNLGWHILVWLIGTILVLTALSGSMAAGCQGFDILWRAGLALVAALTAGSLASASIAGKLD